MSQGEIGFKACTFVSRGKNMQIHAIHTINTWSYMHIYINGPYINPTYIHMYTHMYIPYTFSGGFFRAAMTDKTPPFSSKSCIWSQMEVMWRVDWGGDQCQSLYRWRLSCYWPWSICTSWNKKMLIFQRHYYLRENRYHSRWIKACFSQGIWYGRTAGLDFVMVVLGQCLLQSQGQSLMGGRAMIPSQVLSLSGIWVGSVSVTEASLKRPNGLI